MKFSELVDALSGVVGTQGMGGEVEVRAPVAEDSRVVQPGGVFVARQGGQVDGHAYVDAAVEAGAVAVVGERPPGEISSRVPYIQVRDGALALAELSAAYEGFPSRRLVMIGVTGTDGKTTTASLIHSILTAAGLRAGMISTINAIIGDEELPTGLHVTTPPAPEVQAYLARMVEAGLTHCVLETTSHGLAQHRVSACDFDVAVVTNIQHEHLDFHGSWEAYRDAKAMLFRHLMSGVRKPGVPKLAVINQDDPPSAEFLAAIPADEHLRYSIGSQDAQVRAVKVSYRPDATHVTIRLPDGTRLPVESDLVGAFNVSNILAAVTLGCGLKLPAAAIKSGVEAVRRIPGRMERIDEGQPFLALVDFAHTPNALRRALETARMMIRPGGRVIVVFGSAGLRDPEKRAMMGRVAGELADRVVITAEDPRTESLEEIMAASAAACAASGGVEGETFWRIPDRGEAIYYAVQLATPDDLVIICGKGHEQSMCFGTVEYPWDDREATRAALRGAPLKTLPTAQGD
jgi:UDP-N-acetylmuramoyl-L-alanyl-D-glutamate--2,6-diaminopimelate ligase